MKPDTYRLPKTKVGEKTFNKIIRTGKKLFSNNGYHSTSINDIIAKAKVAAGTFYIYFDNKLALYLYLLDEYRLSIRQASSVAIEGLTTRVDIERAGLKSFIQYVKKDPLAYKVIWESLFVDPVIFKEYYESFSASYVFHLKRFVDFGEVRNDIDLETVSYVLMGISNFVGLQILFRDKVTEAEVDFVVDESMKILHNGLFK
ncbi:MAG: TetR/AcrR family transcriptional regulator [Candidatus Izemoplasmatales bacterium]|nr:TetR/AcrR family transcriptional regulator [Candidatus Izemoplasmatales bacterium]